MAAYTVNFSDPSKTPITINTGTIDYTTSIGLVGRNAPGYGEVVAEDFLHLLENFASPTPPLNPIEGQLWYDTSDSINKKLKINDGAASGYLWYPANGIHQQGSEPTNVRIGDIWVDTTFQQLRIYNGSGWTLIGPSFSESLQTGGYPSVVRGTDGDDHYVILNYLNGEVLTIIAKEFFKPLAPIDGFDNLIPGINLSTKTFDSGKPRLNGLATEASALRVTVPTSAAVSANNFLRKDIPQILTEPLSIDNNVGLLIGKNTATVRVQKVGNDGVISNIQDSAKILFQINKSGVRNTILSIDGLTQRVGINQLSPTANLDVVGTLKVSSSATVLGTMLVTEPVTLSSSTTIGGIIIAESSSTFKDLITVGIAAQVNQVPIIQPAAASKYDLGSSTNPFRHVYADIVGTSTSILLGRADSAYKLYNTSTFSITGQVESTATIKFDGVYEGLAKVFTTKLTNKAIDDQVSTATVVSTASVLVTNSGTIYKITKENFLADVLLATPGLVMIWPTATIPTGWLLCDGTAYVTGGTYTNLYSVIGTTFGSAGAGTFKVPEITGITPVIGTDLNYIIKL